MPGVSVLVRVRRIASPHRSYRQPPLEEEQD
jgi:hypothetical protein